jgi:hypothetical protein
MMNVTDWFGLPGNSEFAASILSLVSLCIAIAAMLTSWKTQKRIVEIEEAREKDRLKDLRKADLIARLVTNGGDRLIIENKGSAEAREISIQLNGRPLLEFPAFVGNQPEIHKVGPNSSFHYLMAFYAGLDLINYTPEISINWTDDSGEPGAYQTTLTY